MNTFASIENLFDIHVRRNEFLLAQMFHTLIDHYEINGTWFQHVTRFSLSMVYVLCHCAESGQCFEPEGFYRRIYNRTNRSYQLDITIPSLFSGCYPIDTLRLSSLECFYNQTCVDMLLKNRGYDLYGYLIDWISAGTIALDPNVSSRFTPHTKLLEVINQAFVEEW